MKKRFKSSWPRVSLIICTVLAGSGFLCSFLYGAYQSLYSKPSNYEALAVKDELISVKYYQDSTPSKEEIEAGKRALNNWKTAYDNQRRQLVVDILVGNSLLGLTYDDVEKYLGRNEAVINAPVRMEYSAPYIDSVFAHGAPSSCSLVVELGETDPNPTVNAAFLEAEF